MQWQPYGLTTHTNKWFLGAGFLGPAPIFLILLPARSSLEARFGRVDLWEGRVVVIPLFRVLQFDTLVKFRWRSAARKQRARGDQEREPWPHDHPELRLLPHHPLPHMALGAKTIDLGLVRRPIRCFSQYDDNYTPRLLAAIP